MANRGERGRGIETLSVRFRQVVGSIVVLSEPLSCTALARLLDIEAKDIDVMLGHLRSVLDVPQSQELPVQLLQASFRDFLLSKERCSDLHFWVDEKKAHRVLADGCQRVMLRRLRKDICDLQWSSAHASEVGRNTIKRCIPTEVQYACQYWFQHLQRSDARLNDNDIVHKLLQKHFLH